jgi:phosphate starvation-inducible protein PhoH and related proteins
LEFDSPQTIHALVGGDITRFKQIEKLTEVRLTTRDGWIKIEGPTAALARTENIIRQLESLCRSGLAVDQHYFRLALESDQKSTNPNEDKSAPGRSLGDLASVRLHGSPRRPGVSPKTPQQLEYLRAIEKHDVVFGIGPAGTGKTYLAVAAAIAALKEKKVARLILSRPAVEAGEALGFLPGDVNEKISPYLRPLYDALYDMCEPDEVQKMIERGQIEIAPLAYMRGRTLARSFIILDESQNTSKAQMLMFLTRLGEGSRAVITGDPTQIDLRDQRSSGLVEAMHVLRHTEGVRFITFAGADVVRHPIVQRIITAYEKARAPILPPSAEAPPKKSEAPTS